MGWQGWCLGAAVAVLASGVSAACAQNDGACLKPGLPLAENPGPQMMRHARAQFEAYLACMAPELARLRAEAEMSEEAASRRDAALAEVDRISERWRNYEERERIRMRR